MRSIRQGTSDIKNPYIPEGRIRRYVIALRGRSGCRHHQRLRQRLDCAQMRGKLPSSRQFKG